EGHNPIFEYLNRNKKSVILNLKSEEGRKIFLDLVKISDVVVQNFMPGTMKRLGIDYDVLKATNPRIIYAALSGYGQTGPYALRPSFDIVGQAMSGIMWSTGLRKDPVGPPIHTAEAIGDLVPGSWAVLGILAALYYREITGEGQMIDVSQVDVMAALVPSIAQCAMLGIPYKEALRRQQSSFWGYYGILRVKDGYIIVGAPVLHGIFDRMKKVMGVEEVDSREQVQEWALNFTAEEALKMLTEGDVPCAPLLHPEEVPLDPHIQARETVVEVDVQDVGRVKMPNFPLKFSRTPASIYGPAPKMGQHTEEVLTTLLGYTREEVAELRKERVI
ncbi:MAG: CaiB/BaiF CoA transferase family protein, partial [Candidatus Bathyarchaeia archaeon]